jgi:anaerobic dimethyl sulfoxide reductase subunit B (iron-sulfur subunit)
MTTRPAFFFDAAACSGCKACQAACKDAHALPVGVRWRRVYEVTGGGWARTGAAWTSDAFALNLSVACHHCAEPACVEACPTGAMHARADGLVLLDADACVGCRYCEWACPYGAPQYDAAAGRMTKCTFCAERIDDGLPPVCVAACPMRALDFGPRDVLETHHGIGGSGWPLPDAGWTSPSLVLAPHRHMARATRDAAVVANREEVSAPAARDGPLVAFTLLMQLAAGCAIGLMAIDLRRPQFLGGWPFVAVAITVLAALAVSLGHLGSPGRAWRALANLRRSWLSREIAFAVGFGGLAVVCALTQLLGAPPAAQRTLAVATAACGLLLIYAMSKVYRLRTMPAWNTPRTTLAFFLATGILGLAAAGSLLAGPAPLLVAAPAAAWLVWDRVRFFKLAATRPL